MKKLLISLRKDVDYNENSLFKEKVQILCSQYLSGIWNKATKEHFKIEKIK